MRFLQLTVENLGVFRGSHTFDLTPVRTGDGNHRPLTVVSGPNGVGKSTLFQAMRLALYGRLALGDRVGRQAYSNFMLSRMHRYHRNEEPVAVDRASAALTFQYFESGKQLHVCVERFWERRDSNVFEVRLRVLVDREAPDVSTTDYQNLINDLIPPGVGSVCFFDSEQMDALSNPDQMNVALADAFERLFGIDVVERLVADLDRFTYVRSGGERTKTRLKAIGSKLRPQVVTLDAELTKLKAEADSLAKRQRDATAQLALHIGMLVSVDGMSGTNRQVLEVKRTELEKRIEEVSNQLREMCGELLPLALAPGLCRSLSTRLDEEAERRRYQAADELWRERVARVRNVLESDGLWEGTNLKKEKRALVSQRLLRRLRKLPKAKESAGSAFVHNVSDQERVQLQNWISHVLHVVPDQVQSVGEQLQKLKAEHRELEMMLVRAPKEDLAGEIRGELGGLEALLAELGQKHADLAGQIAVVQHKRDEADRKLRDATDQLRKYREHELANRTKVALREYKDVLTHRQIAALEQALVDCFNRLCRKEHLLGSVRIEPLSFDITLNSPDGVPVALTSFSAGERHLFALALLWAMRQVGGGQLPLVVDTPLARLDDVHRRRLIHDYVPAVSDQVLFLATDAELDDGLIADADSQLARVHRLRYDEQHEETVVTTSDSSSNRKPSLVTLTGRS